MFIHLGTASGALTPTYRAVKARIWPCFRQLNSARKSTAIVALRNTSLLLETTTYRTLAESICPQKDLNWREQAFALNKNSIGPPKRVPGGLSARTKPQAPRTLGCTILGVYGLAECASSAIVVSC